MILLDREDVERIGLNPALFYRRWVVGERDALVHNYADIPADGPFLLRVDDESAWVSQDGEEWERAAQRTRYRGPEESRWYELADLYAAGAGLTRASFLRRIGSIRKRLAQADGEWVYWDRVYRWPDGGAQIWDGLFRHPWIERGRDQEGSYMRKVRYVSR